MVDLAVDSKWLPRQIYNFQQKRTLPRRIHRLFRAHWFKASEVLKLVWPRIKVMRAHDACMSRLPEFIEGQADWGRQRK